MNTKYYGKGAGVLKKYSSPSNYQRVSLDHIGASQLRRHCNGAYTLYDTMRRAQNSQGPRFPTASEDVSRNVVAREEGDTHTLYIPWIYIHLNWTGGVYTLLFGQGWVWDWRWTRGRLGDDTQGMTVFELGGTRGKQTGRIRI